MFYRGAKHLIVPCFSLFGGFMHISRSTLFIGALAFAAVACGDDVTVTDAPAPTPKVNSVEVSPTAVTVTTGASVTFTAAVNADAGLATTVTWSATGGTVSAAGVFTAPATANPGIAVCATSTVDTGKKGCAQVVVQAAAPVVPATVSISRITGAGGLNGPQITTAAGIIDVTMNINPGNQIVQRVEVLIDGAVAATQTFSAAQSAALRFAAETADQTTSQVTLSINTAAYNTTTGATTWKNGSRNISARIFTAATSSTSGSIASSPTQPLTFANANGFHGSVNAAGSTATSAASLSFGSYATLATPSFIVTAIPVIYSPEITGVTAATVNFGSATCDASGTGARSTAAVIAGGIATATFAAAPAGAAGAGNVQQYEYNATPGCLALGGAGEVPTITAVDNQGNTLQTVAGGFVNSPAGTLNPSAALAIRMDNRRPQGTAIAIVQQASLLNSNSWINAAYAFATGRTAGTDAGVGYPADPATYIVRQGTTVVTQGQALTSAALTNSVDNTVYNVQLRSCDRLNNCITVDQSAGVLPQAAIATFGVDIDAPTGVNNASPADMTVMNAAAGAFSVNFSDALSGFAATGAVSHNYMVVTGSATGMVRTILVGAGLPTAATPFANVAAGTFVTTTPLATAAYVPAPTLITVTATPVAASEGYHIYQARARDQAGNVSAIFSRRVYVANGVAATAVTGLNASSNYTGGAAAAFPGFAQDNTEIISGEFRLNYPNLGGNLIYPRATPTVNTTFDDAGFAMPTSVAFSVPAFVRGLQATAAGVPAADFASAKPNAATARVFNPFGATAANPEGASAGSAGISADFTAAILPTQVANGTTYTGSATAGWNLSAPTAVTASGFTTWTFTATANGPTGTYLNPFGAGLMVTEAAAGGANHRIIAGPGAVLPAGTTVTVTPNFVAPFPTLDNGVRRDFTWTITIRRAVGAGSFDYRVIGLSANHDGLISATLNNVF